MKREYGALINSPLNRRRLFAAQLQRPRRRVRRLPAADQVLVWQAVAAVAIVVAICAATPWRALAEWGL